jgi:hypothetical protein
MGAIAGVEISSYEFVDHFKLSRSVAVVLSCKPMEPKAACPTPEPTEL